MSALARSATMQFVGLGMENSEIAPMVRAAFAYGIAMVDFPTIFTAHAVGRFIDGVSHLIAPPQIWILASNLARLFPAPFSIRFADPAHIPQPSLLRFRPSADRLLFLEGLLEGSFPSS